MVNEQWFALLPIVCGATLCLVVLGPFATIGIMGLIVGGFAVMHGFTK